MRKNWFGSRIFLGAAVSLIGACGMPSAPEAPVLPTSNDGPAMRVVTQVMHRDGESGQPTMARLHADTLTPMGSEVKSVAWSTLRGLKHNYNLSDEAVQGAKLQDLHDAGNGPLIAHFDQEIDGIPVFRRSIKIAMDREMNPQFVTGNFAPSTSRVAERWSLDETVAVSAAFRAMTGSRTAISRISFSGKQAGAYTALELESMPDSEGLSQNGPARVRKVWYPTSEGLIPAYYTELDVGFNNSKDSRMMAFVVSAIDGTVFFRHNLTAADSFSYRVWADTTPPYRVWDSPMGNDYTPHPTGTRTSAAPGFKAANLVTLSSAGTSRNDPWLPDDATELYGNNVFAYADLASPDGWGPGDAKVPLTGPKTFDRVYDPSTDPLASTNNSQAITTNLFYILNWMHDYFYDAGWTESAFNPQKSNKGRGGIEGDPIRGEAQDSGGRNNANASTPADGGMPRIQMYVWDAVGASGKVNSPADVAGDYEVSGAPYGANPFSTTGELVIADDGVGNTADGCEAPFKNAAAMAGKIALMTFGEGNCASRVKVKNAQLAGAKGAIVVSVDPTFGLPAMGGTDATITIGVIGMTYDDGMKLWNKVKGGATVNATIAGGRAVRDGSLEAGVVSHEWGHIMSNRLIGNAVGLSNNQGGSMGEGWSDFVVLLSIVRPEDASVPANANWNGVFPDMAYSVWAPGNKAFYDGLRRYPYSADLTKNPLTFKHIEDGVPLPTTPAPAFGGDGGSNAEVHNAGEVWASVLWECYSSLLRDSRLTFDQANERMRRYLVSSLKLTPNAPTFLEARDAVLAAAWVSDRADYDAFVKAFAKRGMGAGAQGPEKSSTDHAGVVESFVTGADVAIDRIVLDQSKTDCDQDGVLDNDEEGRLLVTIRNTGNKDLTLGTLKVTSSKPEVSVTTTNPATISTLAPFQSTTVSVGVAMKGATGVTAFDLNLEVNGTGLYKPGAIKQTYSAQGNYDALPNQSTTDKFDSKNTGWSVVDDPQLFVEPWLYVYSAGNGMWHGPDSAEPSDHSFVSPELKIGADGISITVKHRYSFETDGIGYYDGGVIELSDDGGTLWVDVTSVPGVAVSNGYTQSLAASPSKNPLAGRRAFGGPSAGYPTDWVTTKIEIGKILAGKSVKLRFRTGSDDTVGAPGWDVDEIAITGLANKPFGSQVPHRGVCVTKPASMFQIASTDQLAIPVGFQVQLVATATGATGAVKWSWEQLDGPRVMLSATDIANPTFIAPAVSAPTQLSFKVKGTNGDVTRETIVNIQVVKAQVTAENQGTGCNFGGAATGGSALGTLLVGAAAAMLRRRRRS
ncbi:MAG TPA: M36 family metallopeptidase [Pseudomonadota bacterium]|nr:M36 family metallopeptidase [Pseudomonadota bacterium]